MTYISLINNNTAKKHPFPYDVPAIKYAKNIKLHNAVTFFVGDNGTGKSTLIETIACKLELPHMLGVRYSGRSYIGVKQLLTHFEIKFKREINTGFFFRAEDFGDLMNSVDKADANLHFQLRDLDDNVPSQIIQEMSDSANFSLFQMRKNYGQEISSFSHGEAYLHILNQKIQSNGIYILDEPESALSPIKQLSLINFIQVHLSKFRSQFIIATHSPILMSLPNSKIFEISQNKMVETNLYDTEHFSITKSFLTNPESFIRYLK